MPTATGVLRADQATAQIPLAAWARRSCGNGAKGRRWYSWAVLDIGPEPDQPARDAGSAGEPGHHTLLVRRNDTTGELAWYRCWTPRPVRAGDLIAVAGRRWTVEENFQAAKGHTGLDQHQVRRWDSWHRWTTLAMLAHAFLLILARLMNDDEPATNGLVTISLGEARRLFTTLTSRITTTTAQALAWSRWRRRHQHQARTAHYHHRETAGHNPNLRL